MRILILLRCVFTTEHKVDEKYKPHTAAIFANSLTRLMTTKKNRSMIDLNSLT